MSKSLSKKGFTLVEVLCSLGVFSIIFIFMMSFDVTSMNIRKNIITINNDVAIIETLKNNIIYSMTFAELQQLIAEDRTFISSENMTVNKIQTKVMDVFSKQVSNAAPYIKLSYLKYEFNVYSLRLCLYAGGVNNIIELQCDFYRGCHE